MYKSSLCRFIRNLNSGGVKQKLRLLFPLGKKDAELQDFLKIFLVTK